MLRVHAGDVPPTSRVQTVLVASNQQASRAADALARKPELRFERIDIAVPQQRRSGEISFPSSSGPDARTQFVVVRRDPLKRDAFLRESALETARNGFGIFVHGYNTSYQEGVFRLAQMTADAGRGSRAALFAWPSHGELTGYIADKEAATSSRDDLADVLTAISRARRGRETLVMAHSMGGWLVMEAMRQLRLQGRDDVLASLRVYLAAPDIDPNVFRAQLSVIGRLPRPMTVFVSKDDQALRLSTLLSRDRTRVGALDAQDPVVAAAARQNGVVLVDISAIRSTDQIGHDRYAHLAGLFSGQDGGLERELDSQGPGAVVLDVASGIAATPVRAAGAVVGQ